MDAFEVLTQQIDEKVHQITEHLMGGNISSFEEYRKLCGEVRGLLTARGYVLDLQQRMEYSDE